jgi:hypothetical protein
MLQSVLPGSAAAALAMYRDTKLLDEFAVELYPALQETPTACSSIYDAIHSYLQGIQLPPHEADLLVSELRTMQRQQAPAYNLFKSVSDVLDGFGIKSLVSMRVAATHAH